MSIKRILIVYPYFTENIFAIFKKFGEIEKEIKFLCIVPNKQGKNIYQSTDLKLEEINLPQNIVVKKCHFFPRKNKNPIINPFCFLFNFLKFKPDKILFLDEAFSPNLFIASVFSKIFKKDLYFYGFENVYKEFSLIKKIAIAFIKKFLKYGFVCNKEAPEVFKRYKFYPKVKKLWWGVDIENFKKEILLEEIKNLKQKLGIRENQKVIGYVGRFIEEKGIKDLVKAFRLINPGSVLIFIGDGPEKKYLEEIKDNIDKKIIVLPPQPHKILLKYYKIMDVLVLPSKTTKFWKEQYGRVLIEAMANGISIVGSDSGSIPEVIGDVGSIFPEGDILRLKEAIEYEFTSRTPEKIEQLKERAKLGSIENFVKEISDFLIRNTKNK